MEFYERQETDEFKDPSTTKWRSNMSQLDEEVDGVMDNRPNVDRYGFIAHEGRLHVKESTLPVEVIRSRESKWRKMMEDWDKWMTKKLKKVKERCRKGIPPSMRGKAWQFLSGSHTLAQENKGLFETLLSQKSPEWESIIKKDLGRTFPYHEMFCEHDGQGQRDLYDVLRAYSVYRPDVGYCQAMAPIVAVLLMHMSAEDSFWCFVAVCDDYLKGYFTEKLEAVKMDGQIFGSLLERFLPNIAKHMRRDKIDPLMYITEWFMCLFSRTLPFATVLRTWDAFFCEGIKVIFRTGLIIVKLTLTPPVLKTCSGLFEINQKLRHLSSELMQEDVLMPATFDLKITHKDLKREHKELAGKRPFSPSGVT